MSTFLEGLDSVEHEVQDSILIWVKEHDLYQDCYMHYQLPLYKLELNTRQRASILKGNPVHKNRYVICSREMWNF